ncbi:hypothetical protein J2045_002150 [Peteryoungia aggregata LMG 23059]|uniref:Uncharacterized protein n=1 Tax=Peteryoungia aggregata LMG 23059 TaxID=1368425 RepID=A0ABU0G759_9HYPH|nr:hypothetical protein [Peteryoungia aggregata]MDQ0421123.1 hypothetical protein [Peteryoungia aggregata LMG 23059]
MAGAKSKPKEAGAVGDRPQITENQWYVLAISTAIFTAVAIVSAFLHIFADGFDGDGDVKLAQALAPFGVALFAMVTFCTVAWRGSINTRQADQSESEGRAKLLQEGAKLLAEGEKPAHVSAGIVTLGVLVVGPDEDYAWQAMNLLADFVEDNMQRNHSNRHRPKLSGVMRAGEEKGINTGRDIYFDCTSQEYEQGPYDDDDEVFWSYIPGFSSVRYRGGIFGYDVHYNLEDLSDVKFHRVEIRRWAISVDDRFHLCSFAGCEIISVSSLIALNRAQDYAYSFERCDFSDCLIHVAELLEKDLKKQGNYYLRGRPPVLVGSAQVIDWETVLLCEDKKPESSFMF